MVSIHDEDIMAMIQKLNQSNQHHDDRNEYIDQSSERPLWYHLTPPHGWINDPCAPGYDAETELYHIFYQCKEIFIAFSPFRCVRLQKY